MKKVITMATALMLVSMSAMAETVYVTERHSVSLRAGITPEDAVVGQATTGTGLELLEQGETHTRVRATDGSEGWIANSLITREKPAALQILAAETRMKQAQAQAAKLEKTVKDLENKLKAEQAKAVQEAANPAPAEAENPATAEDSMPTTFELDLLWLGISFAMLIAGFAAGVIWLRERTRRKLGGMHIRVS